MINNQRPFNRRRVLRGLVVAAVASAAGTLGACAGAGGRGSGGPTTATPGKISEQNPFGLVDGSTVDAVIFKGGYGIDYVTFAVDVVTENHPDVTVKVAPSTNIAQELQPRFVGGNPPDLIDNSGANSIGFNTILDQLDDLTSVIDAKNLEGTKIRDTLFGGVLAPGTFDGKLTAINYVLTVYGMWYSATLFAENGWLPPKTWDEAYALGEQAKAKGKYLFCWGTEAATYYQTLAISSAIKEGGHEVRLALENLKPGCWSLPAVQSVFVAIKKIIDAGFMKPGGAGTQFTKAQAQWSNAQEAILYPSGSWIENEMKKQTAAEFEMTGCPDPTVSTSPKLPYLAVRSAGGEPFIVPSRGKNSAGGKEILRTMLSKAAATNFAKTVLSPTIVKDTVPPDGFGSTALVSQVKMLEDAGDDVYTWNFVDLYGMNQAQLVPWNSFLDGKLDVAGLTMALQEITDKVAGDPSIKKIEVE